MYETRHKKLQAGVESLEKVYEVSFEHFLSICISKNRGIVLSCICKNIQEQQVGA